MLIVFVLPNVKLNTTITLFSKVYLID